MSSPSSVTQWLGLLQDGNADGAQHLWHDTDREKRASFDREGGASCGSGSGLAGLARTGGAARHAGQCAE